MTHRLAAVYAHPDDDTYGLSGTYALNQGNLALTVVVASSGEAGPIADPSLATRESLAEIREREERAALAAVGADGADVHFLRFPDGGLADAPHEELVESITRVLREARPQVVVTFGPEGITRHPDHITVGQATTEAFHNLQAEAGNDAFQRLLYTALPQSAVDRFFELMRASNPDFGDPDDPFIPRGVPDHTITVRVDCSPVRDRKIAALTEHRTQVQEFEAFPRELRDEVFGVEWFVQAWPPVTDPGGQALSSIFQGLDQA
ncbi:hypothetical protein BH20ACT24_BH20ACT24_12290 [soil metagenome]